MQILALGHVDWKHGCYELEFRENKERFGKDKGIKVLS